MDSTLQDGPIHREKFLPKNSSVDTIAGVGSATLLVSIAYNLPESSTIKPWLLILAPTLTIIGKKSLSYMRLIIMDYLQRRKIEKSYRTYRLSLESMINNEHTSFEHKEGIRKKLEEAEMLWVNADFKRLTQITTVTT